MNVRGFRSSFSLSVLVHLLFILCLIFAAQRAAQISPPKRLTWIDLEPLKAPAKKANQEDSSQKQIVQTAPAKRVDHAPKDAFLGEKNQEADRQTVSRDKTITMGASQTHPAHPANDVTAHETASSPDQAQEKQAAPAVKNLSKLGLAIVPSVTEAAQENRKDEPNWARPSANASDYVKGIKEGDRTVLNTKEYVFYTYFQRIRERLDRAWVPLLREKLNRFYEGGRQLASDTDHVTQVLVSLNHLGEIVHVKIVGESGTAELDDTAVRAFNQAGPFPNPPRGIIDMNGEIQIPWQFVLKT